MLKTDIFNPLPIDIVKCRRYETISNSVIIFRLEISDC